MTTAKPLYRELASLVQARLNCITASNKEWQPKHEERICTLVKEYLPSGSGIDNGVEIDLGASTGEKLVFTFGFHHMNDGGYYDGWTDHTLTVKASLAHGIDLKISGRDRNAIKDYLYEVFHFALTTDHTTQLVPVD